MLGFIWSCICHSEFLRMLILIILTKHIWKGKKGKKGREKGREEHKSMYALAKLARKTLRYTK